MKTTLGRGSFHTMELNLHFATLPNKEECYAED